MDQDSFRRLSSGSIDICMNVGRVMRTNSMTRDAMGVAEIACFDVDTCMNEAETILFLH